MTTTLVIIQLSRPLSIVIIIARSGRARRDDRVQTVRDVAAARRAANADDATASVVPASTAVFFGCRRYRDDASVDTEFFAR